MKHVSHELIQHEGKLMSVIQKLAFKHLKNQKNGMDT